MSIGEYQSWPIQADPTATTIGAVFVCAAYLYLIAWGMWKTWEADALDELEKEE